VRTADAVWGVGRLTVQPVVSFFTRLRVYGKERVPREGGIVVACNHFSWVDPPALGAASPRTIHYMAKIEAHAVPGLGAFIRAFGCFPVRRGESDRDAVRAMRAVVRDGLALGLFVEGTRQRSGVPGTAQPGAAMVGLQEDVPVVPVAVHGSQAWRPGNFHPVSIAWGEPMRFDGLARGGRGYREASALVQAEIQRLWEWLVEMHAHGRPAGSPPGRAPLSSNDER
jgi:1-acyl-sn-glycerol-3-phosphate acyltransferase